MFLFEKKFQISALAWNGMHIPQTFVTERSLLPRNVKCCMSTILPATWNICLQLMFVANACCLAKKFNLSISVGRSEFSPWKIQNLIFLFASLLHVIAIKHISKNTFRFYYLLSLYYSERFSTHNNWSF